MVDRVNARGRNPFKPIENPTEWAEHYTDNNKGDCEQIIEWLNANEKGISWLAKLARANHSTLYRSVKGEYKTDPTKFLKKALDSIATYNSRNSISYIPFVKTSVSELIWSVCDRSRRYQTFGVVPGFVGTGKTRSIMEYQTAKANTVVVEADPGMSALALLDEITKILGCPATVKTSNINDKYRQVIAQVKGSDTLLIIDEAETLTPKALEYIRRIRDKAKIGIVLVGTEALDVLIKPEHGQFDQIRSRVNFWPEVTKSITREDAEAIITIAFNDQDEIGNEVYDRIWQYSRGSMRMLVEGLLPAIRDYGIKKNLELNVDLVDSIAHQALNLKL